MNGIQAFNRSIKENIIDNRKYLLDRPAYIPAFLNLSHQMLKQQRVRSYLMETENLTVPPILIISVTNRCNLDCLGCYANAQERDSDSEMTIETIERLIGEASDLGVSFILLAGGEPLLIEGLMAVIKKYDQLTFLMFTNGTLVDDHLMITIKAMRNLIPAISMEGDKAATDARRGVGIYDQIMDLYERMNRRRMLYGTSITLTRHNYKAVMNPEFINDLEEQGCRVLVLIEYVPCKGDPELCLTSEQKADLLSQIGRIKETQNLLPIALPGDEAQFGGCLASGRGFLHISSNGNIEACPLRPIRIPTLRT